MLEYYLAINRTEEQTPATMWLSLEDNHAEWEKPVNKRLESVRSHFYGRFLNGQIGRDRADPWLAGAGGRGLG